MDLDAFVSEHGAEWNRLQWLTAKRRRGLSAAEIDEMVMLYQRCATHLSVVRSRSADPTLVAWLSRLVLQARGALTPSSGFSVAAVGRFFRVTFPVAVYQARAWWIGVAVAFVGVAVVFGALVVADQQIASALLSEQEIRDLVEHEFADYYSAYPPQNFAAVVWTNNAYVSAMCLAGGAILVPAIYVLFSNAFNVGVIGGFMVGNGSADVFFGLILVHGLLELTCVFIAGGVGLRIGWSWIAPGPLRTRAQALAQTGRTGIVVALGLVVPLAISGAVEAFVTPLPVLPVAKLAFGALVWLGFLAYVVGFGRAALGRGETGDVAEHERPDTAPTV